MVLGTLLLLLEMLLLRYWSDLSVCSLTSGEMWQPMASTPAPGTILRSSSEHVCESIQSSLPVDFIPPSPLPLLLPLPLSLPSFLPSFLPLPSIFPSLSPPSLLLPLPIPLLSPYSGVWNVPFINSAVLIKGAWLKARGTNLPSFTSSVWDPDLAFCAWMRDKVGYMGSGPCILCMDEGQGRVYGIRTLHSVHG